MNRLLLYIQSWRPTREASEQKHDAPEIGFKAARLTPISVGYTSGHHCAPPDGLSAGASCSQHAVEF